MDPQGHIAPGLGIEVGYDDPNMADVLSRKVNLSSIIIQTPVKGLDLAPSNIRLSIVRENLYNTFKREQRLKRALNELSEEDPYDLILIDCPPSLGPLVENALIVSDFCIIPCEPSSRSIDGLADFIDKIHEVREGELEDRWHIVLTRVKKAAKLTNEVIEGKLKVFNDRIMNTKIYERESINQSQIAGVPVFDFPRGRSASESIIRLGEEVSRLCQIK
jgi:chromosome partitioning protein